MKTGGRYQDVPRTRAYAKRSTVYHWLSVWANDGTFERVWQTLLGMLERDGKLELREGYLDGSFVQAKRGRQRRTRLQGQGLDRDGRG